MQAREEPRYERRARTSEQNTPKALPLIIGRVLTEYMKHSIRLVCWLVPVHVADHGSKVQQAGLDKMLGQGFGGTTSWCNAGCICILANFKTPLF